MRRSEAGVVPGGFTLLELLVVMGVIGILAAILLPALGSAREQGRRAHCLANLSQISKAMAVYGNSFNEYLPSHAGWGMDSYDYSIEGQHVAPWSGHQGVSRYRVLGYGAAEANPEQLVRGRLNFAPAGLGLLIARSQISPRNFVCTSMSGTLDTWYAGMRYQYTSDFPRSMNSAGEAPLVTGEGRSFLHVDAEPGTKVTAVIGSYSYRDTPFYARSIPANAEPSWTYSRDVPDLADPGRGWLGEWVLIHTKPKIRAQYMCPPFKTARTLGNRSLVADGFDFAPPTSGSFTTGIGLSHHKEGYNVLYGDGHAAWFADDHRTIARWNDWADPTNPGSDNLTISSPTGQRVWNLFDQAVGMDLP